VDPPGRQAERIHRDDRGEATSPTDGVAGETLWVYAQGFAFLDGGAGAEGNGYLNIVSIDIGIR
jgi:hypothetical protein